MAFVGGKAQSTYMETDHNEAIASLRLAVAFMREAVAIIANPLPWSDSVDAPAYLRACEINLVGACARYHATIS